jgi:hypothetical protein
VAYKYQAIGSFVEKLEERQNETLQWKICRIIFYPKCEKSRFLAELCGRKTFYRYQVLDIRDKLGYEIKLTNTTL